MSPLVSCDRNLGILRNLTHDYSKNYVIFSSGHWNYRILCMDSCTDIWLVQDEMWVWGLAKTNQFHAICGPGSWISSEKMRHTIKILLVYIPMILQCLVNDNNVLLGFWPLLILRNPWLLSKVARVRSFHKAVLALLVLMVKLAFTANLRLQKNLVCQCLLSTSSTLG